MTDRRTALLSDVLAAIDDIRSYVEHRSLDDYLRDRMLRHAVERNLIIIGEALGAVRRDHPELAGRIAAKPAAVGLRNIIVHAYDAISDERIWFTIGEPLVDLRGVLVGLLEPDDRPV